MSHVELITTEDGSHSLFRPDLNETYHSRHGAIQESNHVFIRHGLHHWLERTGKKQLVIFEVGFGTGLNAWLTCQEAREKQLQVKYISIEAYPLQRDVWTQLNYACGDPLFNALHESPWNVASSIDDHFELQKIEGKLEDVALNESPDVVYFDAFAPAKQPELWAFPMLQRVCTPLRKAGVFVTYCAKGQLKRDLRALGLQVETVQGPPGKKEMVRATRA
jgi:tRNA U34 5-methylaminomethyl-2-thiouridine-forming methyltransferase MnmC